MSKKFWPILYSTLLPFSSLGSVRSLSTKKKYSVRNKSIMPHSFSNTVHLLHHQSSPVILILGICQVLFYKSAYNNNMARNDLKQCGCFKHNRTLCPRSFDPFYIVCYYINWVKTTWTDNKLIIPVTILILGICQVVFYKKSIQCARSL